MIDRVGFGTLWAPFSLIGETSGGVSPEQFGAAGNGTTDDSAAIALADAYAVANNRYVVATGRYLILSGATLSASWQGVLVPVERQDHQLTKYNSSFIVPSTQTVRLGYGAQVSNMGFLKQGLTTGTDEANALTQIAAFAGTAITAAGDDIRIVNCLAVGFNLFAELNGFARPWVYGCFFDCAAGIELTLCNDIAHLISNEAFPFYSVHQSALGTDPILTYRGGKAFNIHDQADGAIITDNFSFGHLVNYYFSNVQDVTFLGNKSDSEISLAGAPTNYITVGLQTEGVLSECIFDNMSMQSNCYNYLFNSTTFPLQIGNLSSGQAVGAHVRIAANCSVYAQSCFFGGNAAFVIQFDTGRTVDCSFGQINIYLNSGTGDAYSFGGADQQYISMLPANLEDTTIVDNWLGGGAVSPPFHGGGNGRQSGLFFGAAGAVGISVRGLFNVHFETIVGANNDLLIQSNADGSVQMNSEGTGELRVSGGGGAAAAIYGMINRTGAVGTVIATVLGGDVTCYMTSNTQLTFAGRGSDGVVRHASLTLS